VSCIANDKHDEEERRLSRKSSDVAKGLLEDARMPPMKLGGKPTSLNV